MVNSILEKISIPGLRVETWAPSDFHRAKNLEFVANRLQTICVQIDPSGPVGGG